jgi:hypothetical protein
MNFELTLGGTYLFNFAPGWIIGGTVVQGSNGAVTLKDAVYFESPGDASSCFSVCFAGSAKEQRACVRKFWPIPDGHQINTGVIIQATPSKLSFAGLIK